MSKNVLVISTSPRRNGNSKLLADAFANGARQAGNSVENISLHDKTICFCKGCLSCQKSQRCVIHDDADTIAQKMRAADVLVFATPIYYYGMSGQMKTMLDRGKFVAALVAGVGSLVALLAPYSAYGRIASNFFRPVYLWGNNALAAVAERVGSYAFYETEVRVAGLPTLLIAAATCAGEFSRAGFTLAAALRTTSTRWT